MSYGKFVWYDFNAKDVAKAIAFYTETVGWKTQKFDGDMDYTLLLAGGSSVGGVMQLPAEAEKMGAPAHWLAYTSVADVDATVAKARGLGAKVLEPAFDIPEVGRVSVLQDPQGAVFAVYRSESSSEDESREPVDSQTPGAFSWHELMTTDLDGAFDFYSQLFGWNETDSMDMDEMGEYRMFGQGEGQANTYGGMMVTPEVVPVPHWLYYITVADIDAAATRVANSGGQLLNGPMEVPGGGRVAQFKDSQGAAFAFYQPAAVS